MNTVYFIGGSPCSGKSTITEALAERYGLHYFKVDDHLDRYMKLGAADGKESCLRIGQMTPEQIWMRDPMEQCEEELQIYREIFEYVLADLAQIDAPNGVITEGAAFLPELAMRLDLPYERYIAITPVRELQLFHYSKREWVPYVLAECSDKARAFENWMNRDVLFAENVRKQCEEAGYASLVNSGDAAVEELIDQVAAHFGLVSGKGGSGIAQGCVPAGCHVGYSAG